MLLPTAKDIPDGYVMVNDNNHRLDPGLPVVSADVIDRLKERVHKKRVCNSFHLQGFCDAGDGCEYDHEPLDQELLPALAALARSMPCPRRGGCRLEGCSQGHVCQIPDCTHRGGKVYCKLPYLSHLQPLTVARHVTCSTRQGRKANDGSDSSTTSG